DQGYLNTLVESDLRIQYGRVLMIDGDGVIVLDSSMLPGHLNKKIDQDLVNYLMAHRRDGFMLNISLMGSPAVIGFSPVYLGRGKNEEVMWYVLYGRTLQSVSLLLGMTGLAVGIVFLVLASLLVAMSFATARYLLRPLQLFKELSESVGKGKYRRVERIPADEEFSQLTVLYNELLDIIVQRERELSHRAVEMNALCDIGRVIVGEKNYPAAVERILGMAVERHGMTMDSAVCSLYAVDIAGGRLLLRGHGGLMQPMAECEIKALPEEVVTTIIDRKQALYAVDLEYADALSGFLGIIYGAAAFHAGYVYPVISKSGILGALIVAGVSRLSMTGDEHKVMRIVCDEIAQAMENEKLFKDMFERHWEMYWLHEAALIVCAKRDLRECIAAMAKIMTASCKAEKIIFIPVGARTGVPAPGEAYGFYGDSGVIVEHDVIELMARFTHRQEQGWASGYETMDLDDPFLSGSQSWQQFRKHVSAGISIPVRFSGEKLPVGVYYVFSDKHTGIARERYIKMLLTYVSYLGKTLEAAAPK
ncbi:MAG TPA: GAF domain-containing protein, partial [bacterium]|nr:GAF domain-containing protein [bacterium]